MWASVCVAVARYLIPWLALAAGAAAAVSYDFAYRLSGDRRVAPVQVFDDGDTTWLQFPPGQTLPAIFVAGEGGGAGDSLAGYTQQGPYLVLAGTARTLVMRIGEISARAEYVGNAPRKGLRATDTLLPSQWQEVPSPPSGPRSRVGIGEAGRAVAAPAPVAEVATVSAVAAGVPAAGVPAAGAPAVGAPALEFDASLTDQNMRLVLDRWARQAGWMFGPEHWTVDVDIPLAGAAAFGADFRNAVRALLAATELADHPVQPCFYSNRVLRVVPLAQACDRTVAPLGYGVPRS